MRETFNFNMIPIVQEGIPMESGVRSITNISSNGYYGYQAPLVLQEKQANGLLSNNNDCEMDYQQEQEERMQIMQVVQNEIPRHINRKRQWNGGGDVQLFKKRRESEAVQSESAPAKVVPLRAPTHNMPDLPRCIMGHYI